MFESKEKFVSRMQWIPITLGIVWIVLLFYVATGAPGYPSETNGAVYPVTYKSKTVYLTLTEEVLICGSAIGMVVSLFTLQMISSYYWKESDK